MCVVSTNGDLRGGGSRWAFVQIPAVRWVHVRLVGFFSGPPTRPNIFEGKLTVSIST